jgi:hypothetical protein
MADALIAGDLIGEHSHHTRPTDNTAIAIAAPQIHRRSVVVPALSVFHLLGGAIAEDKHHAPSEQLTGPGFVEVGRQRVLNADLRSSRASVVVHADCVRLIQINAGPARARKLHALCGAEHV